MEMKGSKLVAETDIWEKGSSMWKWTVGQVLRGLLLEF